MARTINEINIKLVILGEGGVGKTSLVNSFLKKNISERYIPTIGSNILRKEYEIKKKNIIIRINLWDVGGQKSFNPLKPSFFTNVDAALLVFDLSKPKETLLEIKNVYLENLEKYAKDCLTIVVGNKTDLISIKKDLKKIIEEYFTVEVPLLITSAKTSVNVVDTFELLVYSFLQEWEKKFSDFSGISKDFIKLIGKDDEYLNSKFVSLDSIDSLAFQKQSAPNITKKIISSSEADVEGMDKYFLTQKELKKMETIKYEIIDTFTKNLKKVEKLITNLKKSPIDSLIKSIDNTTEQLNAIKVDFQLSLDSIIKLERNKEGE
jgi:small GTP-binding protein